MKTQQLVQLKIQLCLHIPTFQSVMHNFFPFPLSDMNFLFVYLPMSGFTSSIKQPSDNSHAFISLGTIHLSFKYSRKLWSNCSYLQPGVAICTNKGISSLVTPWIKNLWLIILFLYTFLRSLFMLSACHASIHTYWQTSMHVHMCVSVYCSFAIWCTVKKNIYGYW